jgi:hypothetical protein
MAGMPLAVTFDPVTSTPRVYRASVGASPGSADGDRRLTFGFSGLLYRGGALIYDRETGSLWSQFSGAAIAGPLAGKRLERLRVRQEPLGVWVERHPGSQVLARPELKKIDYRYSPYSAYWVSESFPPLADELIDRSYHPKEVVLGVEVGDATRAYLGSELTAAGGRVVDDFQGQKLKIAYDGDSASFVWEVPDPVQVTDTYWFAWKAHHPESEVWKLPAPPTP